MLFWEILFVYICHVSHGNECVCSCMLALSAHIIWKRHVITKNLWKNTKSWARGRKDKKGSEGCVLLLMYMFIIACCLPSRNSLCCLGTNYVRYMQFWMASCLVTKADSKHVKAGHSSFMYSQYCDSSV